MRMSKILLSTMVVAGLLAPFSARADETKIYTYDALGRLVKVQVANGPNNGVQTDFAYDAASNRSNVTVTGATPKFVVVPLNGFTLIPISGVN